MRFLRIAGFAQIAFGIIFQVAVVWLQISAFRRHRQMSFLLLSVSTLCGILDLSLNLAIHFTNPRAMSFIGLYVFGLLAFTLQAGLGLWGISKLLQDYRELAEDQAKAVHRSSST